MSDSTQEMIEFVTSLPPSINPYVETAKKFKELTQVAILPLWARIIRRIILLQFAISCCQAIAVLWLRKKSRKLKFFRLNKLGLIHVEATNEVVLLMLIFSFLAVLDFATQEFVDGGLMNLSSKLLLRTCKFPIAADANWLFLWICGIEAVMSLTSLKMQARAGLPIKLPLHIRLMANGLLLFALIAPGALLLGIFIRGTITLKSIERNSTEVYANLLKKAPSYNPETFNLLSLLQILRPAQEIAQNTQTFAGDIKFSFVLYLVQHLLIATLYIPTSILAFRGLRQQTISPIALKKLENQTTASNYNIKSSSGATVQNATPEDQVKKRLVKHATLICIDTLLYCPPLMYMLSYHGTHFLTNPTWIIVEQLGTHVPTAIIGNIILTYLIQNTIYTNRKSNFGIDHERTASDFTTERKAMEERLPSFSSG